ncbi:DUF1579 domain-containing protein [Ensifer soli]|uniref:DUF1579 domain-containing protein n=1 Tax=Ciceribacter sp. sgz301302 TaxID=3342379 RepID=UPI0035B70B21
MEFSKPGREHAFLQRLVGEWVAVSERHGETTRGAEDLNWVETTRSVGGLWFISEGHGTMPDGDPAHMVMTLGYDAEAGHYVGTWIGSMMTKLWIYKGWVEADGHTLILEAEGPRMDGEGTALYRDVITLLDDDHRRFAGSIQQEDGAFREFMSSDFKRKV